MQFRPVPLPQTLPHCLRLTLLCAFLTFPLFLASPAQAEPEKFNWRALAADDARPQDNSPAVAIPESSPVVMPIPEEPEEETDSTGWFWLKPQLAADPGSTSSRTAVQLANARQQEELARRHSALDGFLPGKLNGLAPMAVESGIEWRF